MWRKFLDLHCFGLQQEWSSWCCFLMSYGELWSQLPVLYWHIVCSADKKRTLSEETDKVLYTVSYWIIKRELSTLNESWSQARSTNVHFLRTALCLNSYRLHIWFPHFWWSSMRVAYIVSKMSTLFTNSTFSHDCTS